MKYFTKSDVNDVIKRHGYRAIESDKMGKSYGTKMPYRTWEGKIIKGIYLFRTSPVTFTNAGRERGKELVDKLVDDLKSMGSVKRLSEFGFVSAILVSPTKCLLVKGELNSKPGLEYDQTFHYLDITVDLNTTKTLNMGAISNYVDERTEQHDLSNYYLDKILG